MVPMVDVNGVRHIVKKDVLVSGTNPNYDAVVSIAFITGDFRQYDAIEALQAARNDAGSQEIEVSVTPDDNGSVIYGDEKTVLPKGFVRKGLEANRVKITTHSLDK